MDFFKILLVDVPGEYQKMIKNQLQEIRYRFNFYTANSRSEYESHLESKLPDLIICNYNSESIDAEAILDEVRSIDESLPLIFISGIADIESAVTAVRHGASNFILSSNIKKIKTVVEREIDELLKIRDPEKKEITTAKRYESILKTVDGIVWEADAQTLEFSYVSPQSEKILGYRPSQWYEDNTFWENHIYEDDRDWAVKYCEKQSRKRENYSFDYRMIDSEGDIIWIRDFVSVVMESGKPSKLRGILVDITSQKKIEEERDEAIARITERVKEQNCLYNIINLSEQTTIQTMLQEAVEHIPSGFQYPEIAEASIYFDGQFYQTKKFADKDECLSASLNEIEQSNLIIKVIYRDSETNNNANSFLNEELQLLNSIAESLALKVNRILVQTKLQESEQRFKSLVQDGADLISIIDSEGVYKYVSPTSRREDSLGMEKDEFIGLRCYDFIHKNDRDRVRKTINELEPGNSKEVEPFRFKNPKKGWRWLESTITNMTDTPSVGGYVANSRDVTDRREKDRKLRDIVEYSTNLFYRHDVNNVLTFISPQSREFLGCSQEEAKKKWTEFATDNPINEIGFRRTMKAIETGEPQESYELEIQKVTGEKIWVEVNEAPIVENGETVAMVGSLTDITERKEALEKLISTEQKLREIVEHSTNLFFKHDVNHQLEYISPQCYDFVGLTPDEAMNKWTDLVTDHPINEIGFKKTMKALETGEPQGSYELQFKHINGDIVWARVHEAPIMEDGETVGMVGSLTDITEQKEYEAKLEQLSLVAAKTTDIIIITDSEDKITWVNKSFEKQMGYSLEESLGKTPGDLLRREEIDPMTSKRIKRLKEDRKSIQEVILNYSRDDEEIWVDITSDPIFDDDGNFKGYIGIDKDVTEQIRQKKKLQESVERYEIVTQATSDTIWDADLVEDTVTFNSNIQDVFGYKEEEVGKSGEWWLSKIHPEDRERVDSEFKAAELKNADRVQAEYRFQCADGSYKFINDRAYVISDDKGNPVRMIGAMQDITKQKEENMWLKLLESAIANTTEAIAIIEEKSPASPQRNILYVNDAFENLTGFGRNDALGNSLLKFMGPNTDQREVVRVIKCLDRGENCELETSYTDSDGEKKWAHVSFASVKNDFGDYSHWICIGRNVTERRERISQLSESLQEKETLLMEIHHRVKNNLAVVSSMMLLQAMDEQDESLQKKLYDSVARIRTMVTIHEMLYESGSFSKLNFSVNLRKLVSTITETIHNQKKIHVEFNCDEVELNVNQAIPSSLIVNEVVTNSIKHAFKEKESGKIMVDLKEKDNQIILKVMDDGRGLPENFKNVENSSLGLQLIDVLSKQMDANYDFNSKNGDGTEFSIQFDKSMVKGIGNAYLA